MSRPAVTAASYRWMIVSRLVAASVGGYVLSSLWAAVLALGLPMISSLSRAEGVLIATLLSFILYALVVLWVFATSGATRAWLGIAAGTMLSGVLLLALQGAR